MVKQMQSGTPDEQTVRSFGHDWSTYDQNRPSKEDQTAQRVAEYFAIFFWFKAIWKGHLPYWPKRLTTEITASSVYWPLAPRKPPPETPLGYLPRRRAFSLSTLVRLQGQMHHVRVLARRALAAVLFASIAHAGIALADTQHYAPNGNFGSNGTYLPGEAGFGVADVGNVEQVNALPAGVKALVWVGQCNGVDAAFIKAVRPFAGNSRVFGFFLMDDPDPRVAASVNRLSSPCTPRNLMAEADWIHANMPGTKTLITLMNMGDAKRPSFKDTYNPSNTHIDLFGVIAYPCRTEIAGCDYDIIDRHVSAAISEGIPTESIVPFYQAFGAGDWETDAGGRYVLPTVDEERRIIARWRTLIEAPVIDAAYSWGSQRADLALGGSPELQRVFRCHNLGLPP